MSRTEVETLNRRCISVAVVTAAFATAGSNAVAQLTPELVARVQWVEETAISPDGRWVAYVRSSPAGPGRASSGRARDLFLISSAGGESRLIASAQGRPGGPQWAADNTTLAFLAEFPERAPHRQVYAARVGAEPRALTRAPGDVRGFAFSPDGSSIAYLAPDSIPASVAERERSGWDAVVYGRPGPHIRLWLKELSASVPRPITPPDRTVRDFVWSPDGKTFALQITEGTDRAWDWNFRRLYTIPASGGELELLTHTEGPLGKMAWSPDSKRLAFVGATSVHDPAPQSVFVVPAGGGPAVDRTDNYEGSAVWVGWLDSKTMLFGAIEGTRTVVNEVDAALGPIEHVVGGRDLSFAFLGADITTGISLEAHSRWFAAPMGTATHPDELYVGTLDGQNLRRLTSHNGFIDTVRLARQETIDWKAADGLRIQGVLVYPLEETRDRRYPLVIIPHSGPERVSLDRWFGTTWSQSPTQVFAARGYAVLLPNYRGSIGRGVAFSRANQRDVGGKELDDILRGLDFLMSTGLADSTRVATQGQSYGGYFAALAAGLHSDRFKAAMASAPVTNWISFMGTYDNAIHSTLAHWDLPWYQHSGLLLDRSPVAHVNRNWTPLHLDHGFLDDEVSFLQSKELYQALRLAAETKLVLYPREGHEYVEEAHMIDVMQRYLDWLDRHVGNRPAQSSPR